MLISRTWSILLIFCTVVTCSQCSSTYKQKLDALVKKLEELSEKVDASVSVSAKVDASTTPREAVTQPPNMEMTIKNSKELKIRDPSKSYCNEMECPVPKCSDQDVMYAWRVRKAGRIPYPPILNLCESKICIAAMTKMYSESPNYCCLYNMTHITLNSEKILGCSKEVHDFNKKSNPATGVKYWTSGKWSPSCQEYVWCPEKEVIDADAKWKKGFPKAGAGDCVGIQIGNSKPESNGLFNAQCTESMKLFCIEANVK